MHFIVMQPPYTMEQVIDKAKTIVQTTGCYPTAMLEWNAFEAENRTWPNFKAHFIKAYDNGIRTGAGTMADEGYHGAANATNTYPDDDSLQSIVVSQCSQMHNLPLSNNATVQQTNNSVANMSTMMASMQMALQAVQQQLALQAGGNGTASLQQCHGPTN